MLKPPATLDSTAFAADREGGWALCGVHRETEASGDPGFDRLRERVEAYSQTAFWSDHRSPQT